MGGVALQPISAHLEIGAAMGGHGVVMVEMLLKFAFAGEKVGRVWGTLLANVYPNLLADDRIDDMGSVFVGFLYVELDGGCGVEDIGCGACGFKTTTHWAIVEPKRGFHLPLQSRCLQDRKHHCERCR